MEFYAEPRTFRMIRDGVVVAYGCVFPSGKCTVSWTGIFKSIVVWDTLDDLKWVNGHSDTQFIFYD
jgi:hypothetical protein